MKINMTQASNQTRQLKEHATVLREVKSSLLLYHRNLNTHWKGVEMKSTNEAIDDHVNSLTSMAADLDSISNDIIREAEKIKRAEDLESEAAK